MAVLEGAAIGFMVGLLVGGALGIMMYKRFAESQPPAPTTEPSDGGSGTPPPR